MTRNDQQGSSRARRVGGQAQPRIEALATCLEAAYARFHSAQWVADDPVQFAHRYSRPADREVVALLSAAFAWGRVESMLAPLEAVLAVLGPHPAESLREPRDLAAWQDAFAGCYHRRIHAPDLAYLACLLGGALRRHGSLEALWRATAPPDLEDSIEGAGPFLRGLMESAVEAPNNRGRALGGGALKSGVGLAPFGMADADRRGPYKRICMFLRWVARPADGVDLGVWSCVPPRALTMPLDTHVMRWARAWRLTRRATPGADAARELTRRLRAIRPEDPCRYDFALIRAARHAPELIAPPAG